MSLFKFEEDNVTVTKELSVIKEFNDINEREDSSLLFSYIFHLCDWNSPYAVYDAEERESMLKEELFNNEEPPMDILQPAIDLYNKLNTTDSLLLLESARKAVRELREYFENVKVTGTDHEGRNAKDLMANLKSVGDIIKSFKQWEEAIKKEKDSADIRKGVEVNEFNSGS